VKTGSCIRVCALSIGLGFFCTLAEAGATEPKVTACGSRDLGFDRTNVAWTHVPLSKLKRDTVYALAPDRNHPGALRATADRSASFYAVMLKPTSAAPTTLSWSWKTAALVPGADNRDKSREDAPLRVMVAFDGDIATLPEDERKRLQRARKLSGRKVPYALLMYIWTDQVPAGSVIPSAHTSQVKMIAVASGRDGLGQWQSVTRYLADDYRLAWGADPGPVIGVGVMTDTDNTGEKAVGEYAGLRIACGSR
jgi:hypothetical protein